MSDIIVLSDEQGKDVEFEFIDYIDYQEKTYIVLIETDPAVEEVVILESVEGDEGEEESFFNVEDQDVLQAVFGIFMKNLEAGAYREIFE